MITAYGPNIICRIATATRLSPSGLFLPDPTTTAGKSVGQNKANTQEAVVDSIGPAVTLPLTPGDRILYEQFAGTTLTVNGDDLLVLTADHILALLETT